MLPINNTEVKMSDKARIGGRLLRSLKRDYCLYLIALPVIAYFVLFKYAPMYGLVIAFMRYSPFKGISGSTWIGFQNFQTFFNSVYFFRLLRNTALISLYNLIFSFPVPIILALLFNELKNQKFKKLVQTISYLPHFISTVVVVSMITTILNSYNGIVNNVMASMGMTRIDFLQRPEMFRPIYIVSGIWQNAGWNSIIYLAAIAGVSPELYEAATIDGADRFQRVIYITFPAIIPTITILFIMNIGGFMTVGFEKILLMYNELTYETADVISTYVYRKGILSNEFGYSTAVDMFNAVINLVLLASTNLFCKKISDTSLW
ncbi:MAG: ABC transporter permease [Christensenellales bacterium]|jgi:putative aldouronate transport system permease protein